MPNRLAMSRVVQCVEPSSGSSCKRVVDDRGHRALGQPRPSAPGPWRSDRRRRRPRSRTVDARPAPSRWWCDSAAPPRSSPTPSAASNSALAWITLRWPSECRTGHHFQRCSLLVGHGQRGCGHQWSWCHSSYPSYISDGPPLGLELWVITDGECLTDLTASHLCNRSHALTRSADQMPCWRLRDSMISRSLESGISPGWGPMRI